MLCAQTGRHSSCRACPQSFLPAVCGWLFATVSEQIWHCDGRRFVFDVGNGWVSSFVGDGVRGIYPDFACEWPLNVSDFSVFDWSQEMQNHLSRFMASCIV